MALHLIPEPEEKASELLRDLAANDRVLEHLFRPLKWRMLYQWRRRRDPVVPRQAPRRPLRWSA
jgi:hypothetical protein